MCKIRRERPETLPAEGRPARGVKKLGKKERLDKILSSQNLGSRKEAGAAVRAGRVAVNGETVRRPESKADPEEDEISFDGEPVAVRRRLYLMMNKPAGVLSASRDPKAETVVDLLPQKWRRRGMFPAGRLDKDTEGLLILTDDGDFAHRMLSPRHHVMKWYETRLEFPVSAGDAAAFREGIALGGEVCLPAELSVLGGSLALVKIREGKYHQVKRMFLARQNRVLGLRRVRIGGLSLDPALSPGEARELLPEECAAVFSPEALPF